MGRLTTLLVAIGAVLAIWETFALSIGNDALCPSPRYELAVSLFGKGVRELPLSGEPLIRLLGCHAAVDAAIKVRDNGGTRSDHMTSPGGFLAVLLAATAAGTAMAEMGGPPISVVQSIALDPIHHGTIYAGVYSGMTNGG